MQKNMYGNFKKSFFLSKNNQNIKINVASFSSSLPSLVLCRLRPDESTKAPGRSLPCDAMERVSFGLPWNHTSEGEGETSLK